MSDETMKNKEKDKRWVQIKRKKKHCSSNSSNRIYFFWSLFCCCPALAASPRWFAGEFEQGKFFPGSKTAFQGRADEPGPTWNDRIVRRSFINELADLKHNQWSTQISTEGRIDDDEEEHRCTCWWSVNVQMFWLTNRETTSIFIDRSSFQPREEREKGERRITCLSSFFSRRKRKSFFG